MNQLRTDVDKIPLDGRRVLIGTIDGCILISRYVAPNIHHPAGRWVGIASTDWPVAWLEIPNHPYFPQGAKALAGGEVHK